MSLAGVLGLKRLMAGVWGTHFHETSTVLSRLKREGTQDQHAEAAGRVMTRQGREACRTWAAMSANARH